MSGVRAEISGGKGEPWIRYKSQALSASLSLSPFVMPALSYHLPPQNAQVLVIGGGPGGSYAASVLAREGISVTVLEAAKFPRYHVGESLIPSVRHYMRFIGADEKLSGYGFVHKPGSAIKFNQYKREGYTDFLALGAENASFNVIRSEFDHLLLNHARSSGAAVYEQTKVTSISFSPTDSSRPISVSWSHIPPPAPPSPPGSPTAYTTTIPDKPMEPAVVTGTTSFTHLIDATGRAGLMSTMYLKNRHFNSSLKNVAVWGYWTNVSTYGLGTPRAGAPWFEALTDESGWAWFIPLHNKLTSVGVVMNQKVYNEKMKEPVDTIRFLPSSAPNPTNSSMINHYLANISLAPGVFNLITAAGMMEAGSVQSATDFSYSAPSYGNTGYRIVGDAGAFIDPFFSSGVHLALTSALSAASTICASLRGDCSEVIAADWHTKRVSTSYTRFQVVVLSAYKQIRSQNVDVLSDIDEDNFDRAFAFLRPVIQGASDMGATLSETELQKSLDFCVNLFNPTSPEQHARVADEIAHTLLDVTSPIIDPAVLEKALHVERSSNTPQPSFPSPSRTKLFNRDRSASEVSETRMVLTKINARRVMHSEYAINNFESEPIAGYVVRLERGRLGLARSNISTSFGD
ncbi:FAD binding domain-containing protein [Mycena belliarum]|uniref:FAD binding domain-containing protein n=1 Tax=Mycena belliarum TaxID=1033014 RepID=A0AAD6XG93_9AGAR|nr:FAD binding domain-containing protein [Mycena belliae]